MRTARKQLGMSREELASRAAVSARLVAELERGHRPNVSLETALRLLTIVGATVAVKAPSGVAVEIRGASASNLERAARAARRRETWTGRHVHLHAADNDPIAVRSKSKRFLSVAQISAQAHVISAAEHQVKQSPRKPAAR